MLEEYWKKVDKGLYWVSGQSGTHYVKIKNGATSGFEMCFHIGSQRLWCWCQYTSRIQRKDILTQPQDQKLYKKINKLYIEYRFPMCGRVVLRVLWQGGVY